MISFIVIGKNEGWKLSLCFESIHKTTNHNSIKNFEIIYVDSKSTDDSLERAKKIDNIRVFSLTGDCNPAIARNVGATEAKGDVLMFLDGDMELLENEFSKYYSEDKGLSYPFLSGNFLNYYYDYKWNLQKVGNEPYVKIKKDSYTSSLGGVFLIEKKLWEEIGGMKSFMFRGEDPDIGLRLARKGILLFRMKDVFLNHHTISYLNKKRKWERIFNNTHLYGRSLLYRENIFNKYCWKRIMKNDYSVLILFLSLFLVPIFALYSLIPYLLLMVLRTLRNNSPYFENYFLFIIQDIIVLLGFFFFFPGKVKVSYSEI